jgi:hypothetical protein
LLQHGIENKVDEFLEVNHESYVLLDNALLKNETLIITKSDIIEFRDKLTTY